MNVTRACWPVLLIAGLSCADSTVPEASDVPSTLKQMVEKSLEQTAEKSGLTAYLRDHSADVQGAHIVGELRFISPNFPRWPRHREFKIAIKLAGADGTTFVDVFRDIPGVSEKRNTVGEGHMRTDVGDVREGVGAPRTRLTFREFSEGAYFIENAPTGRAEVWFCFPFDGNKITQIPIDVFLQPVPGKLTRLDLEIVESEVFVDF